MARKFIDREPPYDKTDMDAIMDYLFYLKDELNFIFNSYGGQINTVDEGIEKVSDETKKKLDAGSLAVPGMVDIDAGNIIKGDLKSENEKFYLDLITGFVRMASVLITGGQIYIDTAAPDNDFIRLRFRTDNSAYYTKTTVGDYNVDARYTDGTENHHVFSRLDHYGLQQKWEKAPQGSGEYAAVSSYRLDPQGLTFYDAEGNVTASYPAVP